MTPASLFSAQSAETSGLPAVTLIGPYSSTESRSPSISTSPRKFSGSFMKAKIDSRHPEPPALLGIWLSATTLCIGSAARMTPTRTRPKESCCCSRSLFGAYSDFLEILDDTSSREALKAVRSSDSRTDPTFNRVTESSEAFEGALDYIFFETQDIKELTRKYGVF